MTDQKFKRLNGNNDVNVDVRLGAHQYDLKKSWVWKFLRPISQIKCIWN